MTGKIFINYRRGDDPGHTGRLFDRLQDVFEPQELFLDVDNIAPGLDFVRVLNERVAECDVVLAVIGRGWIDARNADGARRLDDPDDFVRIEITSALNQGKRVIPVLVGDAQMPRPEDLPEVLRPLARRNAVRLTHERFRADTQGLIKALRQSLEEIEAIRRAEAETARRAQAEEERRRQEADAARRAEEEERRKEAHRRAMASDDLTVLRSFLTTYGKGADVAQVRKRLHQFEPRQSSYAARPGMVISSALVVVLIAGAVLFWFERTSPPPSTQPASAVTPPPAAAGVSAPAAQPANNTLPETKVKAADTAPGPNLDEVTWSLLMDTTDDAALKRFIAQYPNSPRRKDAEARIVALAAAQAAKADAAAKVEAAAKAEAALKGQAQAEFAAKLEAANKELEAQRAKAAVQAASNQQIVLAMPPNAEQAGTAPLTGSALIQAIKMELSRVGCYAGKLDDDWASSSVKQSIVKFVKAASLPRAPDDPSNDFLSSIRSKPSRVCPLECAKTERESNGQCVAKTCPSGQKLDGNGDCQNVKDRTVSRPSAAEAPPKAKASASAGTVATGAVGIGCGRFGCKEHPVVNAPAGVPCKHAWQGRRGGWNCTD
jgi:hypothetical protein